MFALDRHTGKRLWTYRGAVLINSTMTFGNGRFYLVECHNEAAKAIPDGRIGEELATDLHLVSLDAKTGEKHFDHYYPFQEGRVVFYLTYADDTLLALTSSKDQYHVYAFGAETGQPRWQNSYAWHRNHHGGAMQHPTIVGDVVYAEPKAFNLKTGEMMQVKMPGR